MAWEPIYKRWCLNITLCSKKKWMFAKKFGALSISGPLHVETFKHVWKHVQDTDEGLNKYRLKYPIPTGARELRLNAHSSTTDWAFFTVPCWTKSRVWKLGGSRTHTIDVLLYQHCYSTFSHLDPKCAWTANINAIPVAPGTFGTITQAAHPWRSNARQNQGKLLGALFFLCLAANMLVLMGSRRSSRYIYNILF